MRTFRAVVAGAVSVVALSALLTGCSSPSASGSGSDSRLQVVTSTDVYGDIAGRIGGSAVDVTSIITSAAQDPHEFQASARNQLEVSKADVVIENGGGYDDYMGQMLKTAARPDVKVINVVGLSGKKPDADGDLNEHVWYDMPTMLKLSARLVSTLSRLDPGHARTFAANGASFDRGIAGIQGREAVLKAKYAGEGVSITEPVPLYMLDAIGLDNKTPEEFSKAIEDGTDVAPAIFEQTLKLYSKHRVRALVYNEQTSGPETTAVVSAAKSAKIPVVGVTETLPDGLSYIGWMTRNVDEIGKALAK
jgi:zinc/manganese transport system substrate-binding protein